MFCDFHLCFISKLLLSVAAIFVDIKWVAYGLEFEHHGENKTSGFAGSKQKEEGADSSQCRNNCHVQLNCCGDCVVLSCHV